MRSDAEGGRRIAFVVSGRVQGVAFRAHARDTARALGLTGFVTNRIDGAVEGEAQGDRHRLDEFIAFLHRGSPWSRVERVDVLDRALRPVEASFDVIR
ncbi:MAG: acylphosphatase [Planctomycetota bacterium]